MCGVLAKQKKIYWSLYSELESSSWAAARAAPPMWDHRVLVVGGTAPPPDMGRTCKHPKSWNRTQDLPAVRWEHEPLCLTQLHQHTGKAEALLMQMEPHAAAASCCSDNKPGVVVSHCSPLAPPSRAAADSNQFVPKLLSMNSDINQKRTAPVYVCLCRDSKTRTGVALRLKS